MFKVFGFLTKREGMQMQDFIDYYENKHVALICSLAPPPASTKRRYIVRGEELTQDGGAVDFDVMTELGFPDRAAFFAWMAQLSGPEAGPQVAADEAKFLDRSRTRAYVVDEHVTSTQFSFDRENPRISGSGSLLEREIPERSKHVGVGQF